MKDISNYPKRFLETAERAHKQEEIAPWKMIDRRAAISTAHHFNRFKKALIAQGHPWGPATNDLIVRTPGEIIEFVPRGLWSPEEVSITSLRADDLIVPGLETGGDKHDEALARMLGIELKSASVDIADPPRNDLNGPCEHSWDEEATRCLKCNTPHPDMLR